MQNFFSCWVLQVKGKGWEFVSCLRSGGATCKFVGQVRALFVCSRPHSFICPLRPPRPCSALVNLSSPHPLLHCCLFLSCTASLPSTKSQQFPLAARPAPPQHSRPRLDPPHLPLAAVLSTFQPSRLACPRSVPTRSRYDILSGLDGKWLFIFSGRPRPFSSLPRFNISSLFVN